MGPAPIKVQITRQAKAIERKYNCKVDVTGYRADVNDSNFVASFANGYVCQNPTLRGLDFALGLAKVCGKIQ